MNTVDTLVAQFTVIDKIAVHAICTIIHVVAIQTIFIVIRSSKQIAVFTPTR